jgi:hypothetical protein
MQLETDNILLVYLSGVNKWQMQKHSANRIIRAF